jgi:SAM-dependent methyltransferase
MQSAPASPWVARFAGLLPAGEVLDLACGGGRHVRLLAARGNAVLALDRDPAALALAAGPGVVTMQHDLEAPTGEWPFAAGRFAGIVVTNYLHRPLLDAMCLSLAPNGVLIYETFGQGNEAFGKPSNPAFLLAPGELLALAQRTGLRVVAYEEGRVEAPKTAFVQRICAVGPAFSAMAAFIEAAGSALAGSAAM